MRWRNSPTAWGGVAKTFHWLIALAIVVNIGLGLWADSLPLSPTQVEVFYWHKTIGLTVLWLVALRLFWRLTNPVPGLPDEMASWERGLAHASHLLLYTLMLAMPISGWIVNSAANFPIDLYGLIPVPDLVPESADEAAIEDTAKAVHYWLFVAICGVVALHVAGALKHHFVDRDAVLRRMLPLSSDPDTSEVPHAADAGTRGRSDSEHRTP